jgi:uncharacterized protein (TIGR03435 family)
MRTAWTFIQQSLAVLRSAIRIATAVLILCPLFHAPARAQVPGQLAEFEVASIKPNKSNERMYYGLRNSSLTVRNMTVQGLIQAAYGKRDFQITGGLAWITSECFDIEAKAERPQRATQDMLKSLLATRFHLQLHRETKATSVYSLVIARGGLKMKLSADQSEPERGGPREMGSGRMVGEGIPMYVIVNLLSDMLGRAVVNNTGINGKFDVNLLADSDSIGAQSDSADSLSRAEVLHAAIIAAVEKQLGLKMESVRAPGEVLVIDHVERPSAN